LDGGGKARRQGPKSDLARSLVNLIADRYQKNVPRQAR